MGLVDRYRDIQLELLSRSRNCSEGNQWVWNHAAQCLEETEHMAGFVLGCLAILLCANFYISLSIVHVRRPNQTHASGVILSSGMNLLSEIAATFGAILSVQLPSQILYCVLLVPVHTLCYVYVCLGQPIKTNQKRSSAGKQKSTLKQCMYPFHILLPTIFIITLATKTIPSFSRRYTFISARPITSFQTVVPVIWLPGYLLGSVAGFLLCCVRIIEMIHLYRSLDSGRCLPAIYLTSVLGGVCYIYSVLSQSLSVVFIYHTLPWTLPRLIAVGMDIGVSVITCVIVSKYCDLNSAHTLQKAKQKEAAVNSRCKMPPEVSMLYSITYKPGQLLAFNRWKHDTRGVAYLSLWTVMTVRVTATSLNIYNLVLTSEDDSGGDTDFSDNDSEEINWMPLKIVEAAIPYHPVSVSRVQIVSESNGSIEETEESKCEVTIQGDTDEDGDDESISKQSSDYSAKDKNRYEKSDILSSNIHKNDNVERTNHRVKVSEIPRQQEQTQFCGVKDSSGSSSSDSEDDHGQTLSNTIIKKNIRSLTEVSKEETIASWINNSK